MHRHPCGLGFFIRLDHLHVLWILAPRTRVWGALIVLLLCAAVAINDFHWPGDVVAFVGMHCEFVLCLVEGHGITNHIWH